VRQKPRFPLSNNPEKPWSKAMNKPAKLRLAATILCALALTACGQERPRIALPPADLATCAGEPLAPALPPRDGSELVQAVRDALTLDYILDLRSAGGDCRAKVLGLKAWSEEASKR